MWLTATFLCLTCLTHLSYAICPQNSYEFNNRCYRFFLERLDFHQAIKACYKVQGTLPSLESLEHYNFVHQKFKSKGQLWIGAVLIQGRKILFLDEKSKDKFEIQGLKPVNEDPSIVYADVECLTMIGDIWHPQGCKEKYPYVCEVSGLNDDAWVYNKVPNKCYKHVSKPLNWYEAKEKCKSQNSSLASIEGPQEYKFIQETYTKFDAYWIGFYKEGLDLIWVDGSNSTWRPDNFVGSKRRIDGLRMAAVGRKFCGLMAYGEAWNQELCDKKVEGAICKKHRLR